MKGTGQGKNTKLILVKETRPFSVQNMKGVRQKPLKGVGDVFRVGGGCGDGVVGFVGCVCVLCGPSEKM